MINQVLIIIKFRNGFFIFLNNIYIYIFKDILFNRLKNMLMKNKKVNVSWRKRTGLSPFSVSIRSLVPSSSRERA